MAGQLGRRLEERGGDLEQAELGRQDGAEG